MIWNLPNTLTWLRIFAIPLVVIFFYLPYSWADPAAGLLFAVAGPVPARSASADHPCAHDGHE